MSSKFICQTGAKHVKFFYAKAIMNNKSHTANEARLQIILAISFPFLHGFLNTKKKKKVM